MHNTLSLILAILLTSMTATLLGQKVQYKKGQIFVDKKLAYEFVEVDKEQVKGALKDYSLVDLEGNTVFSMVDTTFYYVQLPNETEKRAAYHAYLCTGHSNGLNGVIPYIAVMGYPKQRIQDLQKAGFFKEGAFDESSLQGFLDRQSPEFMATTLGEIELTNQRRLGNYALTEEKFGPLMERNPAEPGVVINTANPGSYIIEENRSRVANINLIEKGSNNHAYQVVNRNGDFIAEVNIFQNTETVGGLERYKYNLKAFIRGTDNSEGNYKWFYERVKSTGSPESTTSKLEKIARFMVDEGML